MPQPSISSSRAGTSQTRERVKTWRGLSSIISRRSSLDPGYAIAWAGLADVHDSQAGIAADVRALDEAHQKARREIERALDLDPNLAEAYASRGRLKAAYEWDWTGADASMKRALELDAGNTDVVRRASYLAAALGHLDEAIGLSRRAVELDPLSLYAHLFLGLHSLSAGHFDEAEAAFRKILDLSPDYPGGHRLLGLVYLARSKPEFALQEIEREKEPGSRRFGFALTYHGLGRKKEADAALAELIEKEHEGSAFQIAEVYAFRGEVDTAFEWLERAYAQRDAGLAQMKGAPWLKSIEADPRYKAFLKKMRLPL